MNKIATSSLFLIVLLSLFAAPAGVFADVSPYAAGNYGLDDAASVAKLKDLKISQTPFPTLMGQIIGIGLALIGIIFFILILYAGFEWMTALGNSEKATKSKDMLVNAIIGLIIVVSAYAISNFVFNNLVGTGDKMSKSSASSNKCCIYQDQDGDVTSCITIDEAKNEECREPNGKFEELSTQDTPCSDPSLEEFCSGRY